MQTNEWVNIARRSLRAFSLGVSFAGLLAGCTTTGALQPTEPAATEGATANAAAAESEPAATEAGPVDVYLYYGLNDASTSPLGRTVFQDFTVTNGTIGTIWADPDAEHRGDRQGWAKSRISRRTGSPFLVVDYAREGHGTNISVLPREGTPLPIETGQKLLFDLRSVDDACVGVRVQERDAEIWGYGRPPLAYQLLCPPKDGTWKTFSIPLDGDPAHWFHFPYSGNHQLGSKRFESDLLVMVTLELGFEKGDYLGKGSGRLDVRNFRVSD